eukprot:TRINITY_DN9296_c0_g1_i1.p1 TRINITY_DN9296_c0_g1~~TRINITY_DN9296_c0_g1_i1.p1  ORF type:complete len:169 (-),score=22.35 TRINITY_DN9296_c0_g1_i1:227-733(-)
MSHDQFFSHHAWFQKLSSDPELIRISDKMINKNHFLLNCSIRFVGFYSMKKKESLWAVLFEDTASNGGGPYAHGGALATILDTTSAVSASATFQENNGASDRYCVTATLTVNFKKAVKTNTPMLVTAKTVKFDGRKAFVSAQMTNGHSDDVYTEATGLFVTTDLRSKL